MFEKKIQQCKNYDPKKVQYPVYAQVKMDGIFARWCSRSKTFFTRSGNNIQGLSVLEKELSFSHFPDFDGELVIPNIEFFKMNGLIRSSNQTPSCMFYVFDTPIEDATERRLSVYHSLLTEANRKHVHPLKSHWCIDRHGVDDFYKKALDLGYEGIVIKSWGVVYYNSKKWFVQKRVPEKSAEAEIIGFVEGTKSFTGTLGAFEVKYQGVTIKVGGGPGVTHAFRSHVWTNQDKFLGQMMTVTYKSLTPSGSMRSPKFKSIRWDLGEQNG